MQSKRHHELLAAAGARAGHSGGRLAGELVRAGLVDELMLIVGPIAIGTGRPLLELSEPLPTRLLAGDALPPSCTLLRYTVESERPSG